MAVKIKIPGCPNVFVNCPLLRHLDALYSSVKLQAAMLRSQVALQTLAAKELLNVQAPFWYILSNLLFQWALRDLVLKD